MKMKVTKQIFDPNVTPPTGASTYKTHVELAEEPRNYEPRNSFDIL